MASITTPVASTVPQSPDTSTGRSSPLPRTPHPLGRLSRGGDTLRLLTVLLGAFLSIADFFIVNVALPTIDQDLHASAGLLELVVAGYAVAYAVLLVTGGRLGDSFGRKRL